MNTTARYQFIRELAQHRAISPELLFRRLKFMGAVFGISLLVAIATAFLIAFATSMGESTRLLAAFGLVAAFVLMLGALISTGLLLWGGFVSQYVSALDAKEQLAEAFTQADEVAARVTPTKANEEMVQVLSEDAFAITTALALVVDERRAAEVREWLAEFKGLTVRMVQIERSLTATEQQRAFHSLRPRFVRIRRARQWPGDDPVAEAEAPFVHNKIVG